MLATPDMFAALRDPDAIATDPLIDDAAVNGAIVIYSLSGGKDCGAVAALANKHLDAIGHPRALRYAMHADLGRAEWPGTIAQVEAQAASLGVPLFVERANAGDLPARFANRWQRGKDDYRDLRLYNLRGPWSSPSLKFCQSEKKIQVMGPALARRFRGKTIIQVTGLRRDESAARRTTVVAKVDERFAKPGNRAGTVMLMWNPGVDMTREEVFAANRRHGIPLSRVYGLGCSRHSCAACVMASVDDLTIAGAQPENAPLFTLYISMELDSTFSFQSGGWIADKAPHLLTDHQRTVLAIAKRDAGRRRALEASMPARHRYVNGWPLYVPDRDEAIIIAEARSEILSRHQLPNLFPTPSHVIDRFAGLLAMKAEKAAA